MTLSLTADQLAKAQAYAQADDYAGGWAYLASIGDSYADNASAVINASSVASEGRIFALLVEQHWENTAGRAAYEQKFDAVAHSGNHFRNGAENGPSAPEAVFAESRRPGRRYAIITSNPDTPSSYASRYNSAGIAESSRDEGLAYRSGQNQLG